MLEVEENDRWHLKREIQVGHIVTTLAVAVSSVIYITAIEKRVALLEANVLQQKERDIQQDASSRDNHTQLRSQLERMEQKLDRLIEKNNSLHDRSPR